MTEPARFSQPYYAVAWHGDINGHLRILDQTRLPSEIVYRDCKTVEEVWQAIRSLQVRGAPAIGIAAAYGVVLAAQQATQPGGPDAVLKACDYLATSRPTAVNLFWALNRMRQVVGRVHYGNVRDLQNALLREAHAIRDEDAAMCRRIARVGAQLIHDGMGILTHCNTGALATAEYGTALGCIFFAAEEGKRIQIYADETRPLLQGARLTVWELMQRHIPVTLICDNMAAVLMRQKRVQLVLVGADRIAANGDTANKIGTYGLAVLARAHGISFYVAAPSSTFDLALPDGKGIPIEERDPREITEPLGCRIAPEGAVAFNPAFDVTPAELITGIITERGIIKPLTHATIANVLGSPRKSKEADQ
ncbi:MAG: S-methyl-5-thioribose-1-phosphate isomerase [Gemmatales bacterium]|nr:S-methyl-5-thioribose-1-phosphate isomerase [Gemmatales bacterium]MDW8386173.1 S-methyl-5-thioribose-1-phosphate isomerase [Gemmatales bacterium]